MADTSCGCRGCCKFPNGLTGILVLIIGIVAYLCGTGANNLCYFVWVDLSQEAGVPFPAVDDVGMGLWSREEVYDNSGSYCVTYDQNVINDFFDTTWRAARAMAIIADVCGGVSAIICICLSCCSIPRKLLMLLALLSASAGLFQSLTFLFYATDFCQTVTCQFGPSSATAVAAIVLYFFNACLIYKMPEYHGEEDVFAPTGAAGSPTLQGAPPGSVSVEVTNLPDGTKKTVRTTVNADGTRTVEETIEHPAAAEAAEAEHADLAKSY